METTTRTIELTVERLETRVMHRRSILIGWCAECGRDTMTSPEDAARICGLRTRSIYAKIEAGKIHFVEFPEGEVLICINSLRKVQDHE